MLKTVTPVAKGFILAGFVLLWSVISINAATFTVTKIADTNDGTCDADCSFREAVAAANAAATNDEINFDATVFSTARTIVLSGQEIKIANPGSLTVNGTGTTLLTISGNNQSRVLSVGEGANLFLNNLRITGGTAVGDFLSGQGGGILNARGTVNLNNVLISGNPASNVSGSGGGIYNYRGVLIINNSTITNNRANDGGGIYNSSFDGNGTISISNSNVSGNISNSGGGIYNMGPAEIVNTTINDNSSEGIYNRDTLNISGSTISGNFATGLYDNGSGQITLTNSTVANNFGGGGISSPGSLTVINSTVINNTASNTNGGGISSDGQLIVTNSTIRGNTAAFVGGGIYKSRGTLTLTNSTVSGNTTTSNDPNFGGGGIYCSFNSTINIDHSTIVNNSASVGGGILNPDGIVNSRNSIIADNFGRSSAPDFSGTLTSQGYNLVENTSGTIFTGNTNGNILGQDPHLASFGNYGGTVQMHALMPTSPAIDAADPNNFAATDQRGVARPQDGDFNGSLLPDIGAYERQPGFLTVTKTADTNDNACDSDCSLREALATANASPVADRVILFDPSVFTGSQTITLTGGQLVSSSVGTLLIKGAGASQLSISGNNLNRVLFVDTAASVALEGVTITAGNDPTINGFCGGGGILVQGTVVLKNAAVTNSRSELGGGGVCTRSGSRLIVSGSTLSGNSGKVTAGAIYNNAGNVLISNSVITNNISERDGGGVVNAGGVIAIDNSQIIGNTASRNCGGLRTDGAAVVTRSVFDNNKANTGGGGGLCSTVNLTISNTSITNNKAAREGAGLSNGATLNGNNLNISGNQSNLYGGGIYHAGTGIVMTLANSTISGNTATGTSMNDGNGGGIYNSGTANLTNSTVTNNSASASSSGESGLGGGVFNMGIFNAANVTISNNSANRGGGVRNGSTFSSSSTFNSRNSIFADNTAAASAIVDFDGVLASQGYNLIEVTTGTTITGTTSGNILGQDPKLGALKDNGGFTQTRALLSGSPAIDAANPVNILPTDQRGITRPKDGDGNGTLLPDIGAFERDFTVDNTAPFDFDGDGKTEIGIFRASDGSWWYSRSSDNAFRVFSFGTSSDVIAPGDFTGDGKADLAVFRPASGEWFIQRSEDNSFFSFPFGAAGDVPVPADYDGDGKTDAAVFRPSSGTWFILNSNGSGTSIVNFGSSEDKAVPADFDGDGKADIAIFRPSDGSWWYLRSTDSQFRVFRFGLGTDKPVQGDYTGDGKADLAVFRPETGEWFFQRSEDNSYYSVPFGALGDIPTPGDYDGDGKFDTAVFRPSTANWFVQQTTAGTLITTFGATGDRPIPNAFVP